MPGCSRSSQAGEASVWQIVLQCPTCLYEAEPRSRSHQKSWKEFCIYGSAGHRLQSEVSYKVFSRIDLSCTFHGARCDGPTLISQGANKVWFS
ncbi:hypothetical protein GDO81_003038 [Engystomops pustulosus]|uniref:Uncharacterized protein n=1 Tax=Engystomops pustulosus TaxID=76066 RepID=A0AAV7A1G3_ENGPU|nr:hypothetical protein GDO81_003038 [Engystomops pustulosus]